MRQEGGAGAAAFVPTGLWLAASGGSPVVQTFTTAVQAAVLFDDLSGPLSYSNDSAPYQITGPGAGQADTVTFVETGLYLITTEFQVGGAAAAFDQNIALISAFTDHSQVGFQANDRNDDGLRGVLKATKLVGIDALDASTAGVAVQVLYTQSSGGNRLRDYAHLQIVRLSDTFP